MQVIQYIHTVMVILKQSQIPNKYLILELIMNKLKISTVKIYSLKTLLQMLLIQNKIMNITISTGLCKMVLIMVWMIKGKPSGVKMLILIQLVTILLSFMIMEQV